MAKTTTDIELSEALAELAKMGNFARAFAKAQEVAACIAGRAQNLKELEGAIDELKTLRNAVEDDVKAERQVVDKARAEAKKVAADAKAKADARIAAAEAKAAKIEADAEAEAQRKASEIGALEAKIALAEETLRLATAQAEEQEARLDKAKAQIAKLLG